MSRAGILFRTACGLALCGMLLSCSPAPETAAPPSVQPTAASVQTAPTEAIPPTTAPAEVEQPTAAPTQAEPGGTAVPQVSGSEAAGDDAPRSGGTIVVALETDPPSLNPAISLDSNTVAVGSKIFNGLTISDPSFVPQPGAALAKSWEITEDGLTYTIHLQEGVKWQDGEPFSCEDVKFTYTEVIPKFYPGGDANLGSVESVECTDDNTVVFQLSKPFSPLLAYMKADGGAVLPKHIYEGTDILQNPANLDPIGTGPFMLEEWVRGDHITLVRNPNYFLKGRPFLDKIIYKIIPDANTAMAAFEAGEVDYIPDYRVEKSQVERLSQLPGVEVGYDFDAPKPVKLFFNLVDCKPCSDVRVRQAISYAIDRQAIADLTMFGFAVPMYNPFPPQYSWAYNKDAQEPGYDPAKANALLDEAGYPVGADGTRLSLTLSYQSDYPRVERPNDVIKEQLKAVGIDLILNPMDRNLMIEEVHHKYKFELHDHLYSTYGDPALGISRSYLCSQIDPKIQFVNVGRYCNEKVDELFALGDSASTLEERAKAYFEVQQILVDELPVIDLFMPTSTELSRAKYKGIFLAAMSGDQSWDYVWSTDGQEMAPDSYDPIALLKK